MKNPEYHRTARVPMLDVEVWAGTGEGGQGTLVRHSYYKKPSTSPLVFHARGACPARQKIIILAEEMKRRLFNQDRSHSVEERMVDGKIFIQKLIDSGYDKATRLEILKAGIKRYYRLRLQEAAGNRRLYRSGNDLLQHRTLKPLKTRA